MRSKYRNLCLNVKFVLVILITVKSFYYHQRITLTLVKSKFQNFSTLQFWTKIDANHERFLNLDPQVLGPKLWQFKEIHRLHLAFSRSWKKITPRSKVFGRFLAVSINYAWVRKLKNQSVVFWSAYSRITWKRYKIDLTLNFLIFLR